MQPLVLMVPALLAAMPAAAAGSGSLCIPPMPPMPAVPEAIDLIGIPPGSALSIRVDHRDPAIVSPAAGAHFDGLALDRRHLVRIAIAGERRDAVSFRFDFRDGADLCLWYGAYGSFSLRPRRDCACR